MYPCFESVRRTVRNKIQSEGGHMKVRFANRGGKFYCTVVDEKSGQYDNRMMNYVRDLLDKSGGCHTTLTSAGGGKYTYRFEVQDFRD